MRNWVSPRAVLFVATFSLSACGAPSMEEGSESELGSSAQALTSTLTFTRNSATGNTVFTNTVTAGTAPFTYYWQTTTDQEWNGHVMVSGWYQAGNSQTFHCPRAPIRGEEYLWSLKVETYAVDATGAASPVVYRTLPCSIPH